MMKKISLLFFGLCMIFALTACGSNNASNDKANEENANAGNAQVETDNPEKTTSADASPIEPTEEDVCAFCNMKIYTKNEEMGVFTAQAIDSEGKHLFFDDSGCMLNYERKTGEALSEKWVRDYVTKEWIVAKDAVPVHAEMKTPMKYGYAFFTAQDDADKFVSDSTNVNAMLASWDDIDQVSKERYMKKMEMSEGSDHSEHDHVDEHSDDHGDESEGSH